jgi:hypothetical protein
MTFWHMVWLEGLATETTGSLLQETWPWPCPDLSTSLLSSCQERPRQQAFGD